MSILDKDIRFELDPATSAAQDLIDSTKHAFRQMVRAFEDGTNKFWNNENGATPEHIAEKLGSDAAEIFNLHYKLSLLLSEIRPELIQHSLAKIGNFTINQDGTVTIMK